MKKLRENLSKATTHSLVAVIKFVTCSVLMACAALISVTAQAKPVQLDSIVAVVNKDVVTKSELQAQQRVFELRLKKTNQPLPPSRDIRKQVLDFLIDQRLQLQVADARQLKVDEALVDRTIQSLAKDRGLSLKAFWQSILDEGYQFESFKKDVRRELLVTQVQQRELSGRIRITAKEIDNVVKALEMKKAHDQSYHVAHILVALPEEPSSAAVQAAKRKANKILTDLHAGQDFAKLAIGQSQGNQALRGGDLGWRKTAELPGIFARQIKAMNIGEVRGPIRSGNGYHLIKLLDKRSDFKLPSVSQIHVRHILIRTDRVVDDKQALRSAKALRKRLEKGEKFSDLAKEFSDDPNTATRGGDLGWIMPNDMGPAFAEKITTLKDDAISQPFKTSYGWHIIQRLGIRDSAENEDLLRELANRQIYHRKFQDAQQNWITRLRDQAHIDILDS